MAEGDRPGGAPPPPPPRPNPGPPRAIDDPVKLSRAARILERALARQGLTVADLEAPEPVEHARAA